VSADDVQVIRRGIDAYNAGDLEGVIEMTDPEATLVPVRSLLEGGEYRGHEGVRRFMADMEEDWAQRSVEVDEIRELDRGVLVLGSFHAVGRSGTEVRFPVAWHSQFRDGRLYRLTAYSDQDTALRELGLADRSSAD
jgi:ketosteroid isomerase-like protein